MILIRTNSKILNKLSNPQSKMKVKNQKVQIMTSNSPNKKMIVMLLNLKSKKLKKVTGNLIMIT